MIKIHALKTKKSKISIFLLGTDYLIKIEKRLGFIIDDIEVLDEEEERLSNLKRWIKDEAGSHLFLSTMEKEFKNVYKYIEKFLPELLI